MNMCEFCFDALDEIYESYVRQRSLLQKPMAVTCFPVKVELTFSLKFEM